jgi:hypothetical protein
LKLARPVCGLVVFCYPWSAGILMRDRQDARKMQLTGFADLTGKSCSLGVRALHRGLG